MNRSSFILAGILIVTISAGLADFKKKPKDIQAAKVEIGRQLFFDKALSNPDGQSCTVCHAPRTSFSDPNHAIVSEGMIDGAFVNRNSQSLTYLSFIPPLAKDNQGEYHGGLFWDGRSNNMMHQLSGPFFNPAEMNNKDTAMLVSELVKAPYYKMYRQVYGKHMDDTQTFRNMCEAIVAFESSALFNEFSSKFDMYAEGKLKLSEIEMQGLELFKGKARCVTCHSMTPDPVSGKILFSDYSYHNLGLPKNPQNPFYTTFPSINPKGHDATDRGLGAVVNDPQQDGKFRVPTLRNVQYTGPYFHNGYFKTLREAVHFLNARDADPSFISASPEIPLNIAHQLTGSIGLSDQEEEAIVAFLLCLTDGYTMQ